MARGGGLEVYGALILRLTLGTVFLLHAYRLLLIWGPTDLVSFQRSYGMPLPALTYWYAVLVFGAGGVLMILGVLVRWVSLLALPIFAMAAVIVQGRPTGAIDRTLELWVVLFMVAVAQSCLGAGAFTLKR